MLTKPLLVTLLLFAAVLCAYLAPMACAAPVQDISDGLDRGERIFCARKGNTRYWGLTDKETRQH